MERHQLLIELGSEELPPKSLRKLMNAFRDGIEEGLKSAAIGFQLVDAFSTPRRLAVIVHELDAKQPDQTIEKRGPALAAARDAQGNPSKGRGLRAFLRGQLRSARHPGDR